MKKLFTLSLMVLLPLMASAYDAYIDGIYYNLYSNGDTRTAEVTFQEWFHASYSGEVIIPESITYDGVKYCVTSIGRNAFADCVCQTITIPSTITIIGEFAFEDCFPQTVNVSVTDLSTFCNNQVMGLIMRSDLLSSITLIDKNGNEIKEYNIPDGVTSIGNCAFYHCGGLLSVSIPNSVTSIGGYAFYGCSSLNSITIPNSVTSIGYNAFSSTPWFNNQPDGIVYAGKVLYSYKGIMPEGTSITIKDGTSSITDDAFYNCSGLTSVTIPNSVTSIGISAFSDCSSLTSVKIPNSVTSIGSWSFYGCSSLNSITIPNSVTSIGGSAFYGCSSLSSITIPNSVISIGAGAFSHCSNLASITIPNSVTSIGGSAFHGTQWFDDQLDGIVYAGKVIYTYKGNMPEDISLNIEEGTLGIADFAFSGCAGLTSVTIPNSMISIGDHAFANCRQIVDVYCYAETVPYLGPYAFSYFVESLEKSDYWVSLLPNITLYVPKNAIEEYKTTSPWSQFKEFVPLADDDDIKITSAGQTTWCSAYDLDFTDVEGLKAYIASGYDRETGTIWLTRAKKIPAGEGILLIGDEGEYKVPHVATTAYYANLMKGTVEAITINETDGEYTNYYLSNGASGIGFYKVNGSVALKANRAYLPLLKNTVSSTRGFIGIDFDDDAEGTTGIHSIENGKFLDEPSGKAERNIENDVYYNLQGQRVDYPSKGLYIRNGKKVIIH